MLSLQNQFELKSIKLAALYEGKYVCNWLVDQIGAGYKTTPLKKRHSTERTAADVQQIYARGKDEYEVDKNDRAVEDPVRCKRELSSRLVMPETRNTTVGRENLRNKEHARDPNSTRANAVPMADDGITTVYRTGGDRGLITKESRHIRVNVDGCRMIGRYPDVWVSILINQSPLYSNMVLTQDFDRDRGPPNCAEPTHKFKGIGEDDEVARTNRSIHELCNTPGFNRKLQKIICPPIGADRLKQARNAAGGVTDI
ncbi:hypothetical protein ARMGADRAFT_1040874 [Armillaria gallica]|uniref:Uncharacterized protein n=1 Tax=Armillaria gallica TaxID=47427 RepID=A0A2H3CTA5_ARMGA|nr:hypothetical protein ARMGADRAFT_1040874 [Armillaria gallica]